jgi:hypothetical protein
MWPAIMELLAHESLHTVRKILTRQIAKNAGVSITNEDWVKYDYGNGEYSWPGLGDTPTTVGSLPMVGEEAFTTSLGHVVEALTPHFLEMAVAYIPELKTKI